MITPKAGWGQDVTRNSDLLAGSSHTHVSLGAILDLVISRREQRHALVVSCTTHKLLNVTDLCQGNPNAG
jgi:hypothetical protein